MSENETRLRALFVRATRGLTPRNVGALSADLDALLAEHRAEMEASEAERKKLADRLERAVENVATIVSAARDAALEEAKGVAVSEGVSDNRTSQQRAASARANIIAERINALKSQPTRQYVDAEKVREVLRVGAERCTTTDGRVEFSLAARALGVDLDAEGEHQETQRHGAQVMRSIENTVRKLSAEDTRQPCTCIGTCRGPDGLGAGWKCALGRKRT